MSLVFVTGISGFLGSHLVNELLIAGYRVRGTVKSGKMPLVEEGYADSPYKDRLEIVEVNDFVSEDVAELLKGQSIVFHKHLVLIVNRCRILNTQCVSVVRR
jgi:nucleoside-diphosphate-sugar epimerase